MRTFLILILSIFSFLNLTFAQKGIQRLIFEDLLVINDLYGGNIIQPESGLITIMNNGDTIRQMYKLSEIRGSFETHVLIISVDYQYPFYVVEATFPLLTACVPYFGLLSDTFKYILYKEYEHSEHYYRVDGFLVSDILKVSSLGGYSAKTRALTIPYRYIRKKNTRKIQNYLSVSILKKIKDRGYSVPDKPYVIGRLYNGVTSQIPIKNSNRKKRKR